MSRDQVAKALYVAGIAVFGLWTIVASTAGNQLAQGSPPSQTPAAPVLMVEGASGGLVTISPTGTNHYVALPLNGGMLISFDAPWPTVLKVSLRDPQSPAPIDLTVFTASQVPPAGTAYAQTSAIDATPTPARWKVTVKPPPSFDTRPTFDVLIAVDSVNPNFSGSQFESLPLILHIDEPTYKVHVATSGDGRVTASAGGINCGNGQTSCDATFNTPVAGAAVNFSLIAITVGQFSGWGGDCTGSQSSCSLVLDPTHLSVSVTAAFTTPSANLCANPKAQQNGLSFNAAPNCFGTGIDPEPLCDPATGIYICCSSNGPAALPCSGTVHPHPVPATCAADPLGVNPGLGTLLPGGCYK